MYRPFVLYDNSFATGEFFEMSRGIGAYMITTFGKRADGTADGKIMVSGPDLGRHIAFVHSVLDKYEWEESTKAHIRTRLSEIIKKQEDKLLSLCVVGEFSSGKSTFINALLRRDDLLVSSALQGTTVAATVLEDSRNYRLILEYRDGRNEKHYFTDASRLRSTLPEYTTDPEKSKNIKYVRIGLPANNLARGFRVIDTPGTNSTEPMHEKITAATIKERADMSIPVIDANKPLSETFCSFIKMNFSREALDNCIFVVTRIDMIRKGEREGVISFLRDKISAEFGIDEPVVLPFASTHVLDCMDKPDEEKTELARMSLCSEDTMLLYMAKKKEAAQKKKLISLTGELYKSLSEKLSVLSKKHNEKLERLVKNRISKLEPFTREQIRIRTLGYTEKANRKHLEIRAKLDRYIETATKNILRRADTANTADELRAFLSIRLPSACNTEKKQLAMAAQIKFSLICDCFESEMDIFRNEFDRLFGSLISSDSSPAVIKYTIPPVPNLCSVRPVSIEISDNVMSAAKGRDAKKNVMRKLEPEIRRYFEAVCDETEHRLEEYIKSVSDGIAFGINAYLGVYKDTAENKMAAEEEKIAQAKNDISSIAEDAQKAEQLKEELQRELGAESFADIAEKADMLKSVLSDGEDSEADTEDATKKNNTATFGEKSEKKTPADTKKDTAKVPENGNADNANAEAKKHRGTSINIDMLMGMGLEEDSANAKKKTEETKKAKDHAKSIIEKFSYGFGDK